MRAFSCLVAVLATLLPAAAHAQLTTIKVPETVFVGISVNVTFEGGSSLCGAVFVDFGDPADAEDELTTPNPNRNGKLPFDVPHTWKNEGVFTIKANGEANCNGTATAVVKVIKFKISPRPKISGYFGLARPGGVAGIKGLAFGSTAGTVTATLKKFDGQTFTVDLDILEKDGVLAWQPGLIGIKWPDITGVRAQNATLRVKVANRSSNDWTVAFVPESEFKVLPQSDVQVVSCSLDANDNVCNHVLDTNPCAFGVGEWADVDPWPNTTSSIHGWHSNCGAVVGDDAGTDVYRITLKNDWVLESFDFDADKTGDDGDFVKAPTPAFPQGASTWKVSVKWLASADDEVTYDGQIRITGPKGVPHK